MNLSSDSPSSVSKVSFVKTMIMKAMRRNTKVNTLKRRRTVLETVELEGALVVAVAAVVVFVLFSISKPFNSYF